VPISENKELVESKTSTGYSGVFRLSFTVDDVVREYSVTTPFGVNLIVMGTVKSMGSGCMCAANAVVRALLRHLIVERNEAVILDMEAGVEHIGRGTASRVDALLIVADANLKSLEVAKHIHDLATKAGMKQIFLIGNRVMDDAQKEAIRSYAERNSLPILAFVPFDSKITETEMRGETPLKHKEIEAVRVIDSICEALTKKNI
jgi:CO dehydrogenase maturation factor